MQLSASLLKWSYRHSRGCGSGRWNGSGENRRTISEIGGTFNGSGLYVHRRLALLHRKDEFTQWQSGIHGALPGNDLDWDNTGVGGVPDNQVFVQLSTEPLTPGDENSIAVIFDLETLEYSVNGAPPATVNFTNRGSRNNWYGNNETGLGSGTVPAWTFRQCR